MNQCDWSSLWAALTAIGTWALAIATWFLVKATWRMVADQRKVSLTDLKVRLQLEMEKKFDSRRMAEARSALAGQILSNAPHDDIQEDVMNFFESVGTFLRRGYLDAEMSWGAFSFHAARWWSACKDYIIEERKQHDNDATIFEEFQKLVDALYEVESEKRRLSRAELEPSPKEIRQFLLDESRLK
jgi:hypothetical protein